MRAHHAAPRQRLTAPPPPARSDRASPRPDLTHSRTRTGGPLPPVALRPLRGLSPLQFVGGDRSAQDGGRKGHTGKGFEMKTKVKRGAQAHRETQRGIRGKRKSAKEQ